LEVSVLSVELADSVFELSLGLVFVGNKLVEGVNELVSQVVEGFNDLMMNQRTSIPLRRHLGRRSYLRWRGQ